MAQHPTVTTDHFPVFRHSPTTVAIFGNMLVRVILDQPANVAYTNLDQISGQVILRTQKSESVNAITVKLEGESRTRLMSPPGQNGERPKPMIEYHKLLYKVQTVFPDAHVADGRTTATGRTAYGLPPGEHVYPFSFKVPSCTSDFLAWITDPL